MIGNLYSYNYFSTYLKKVNFEMKPKQTLYLTLIFVLVTVFACALLWLSPWGQITECRYRFSKIEKKFTDKDWSRLIDAWIWDIDWWPWGMGERWDIGKRINMSDRWVTISKSGMVEHLEKAKMWSREIDDTSLRAKKFLRLADAAGRLIGDKLLAFNYLENCFSAAKTITNEEKRQLAFHEIMEIVGGLNDMDHGFIFLEEIASEMKKIGDAKVRGYGFRALTEAAGELGDSEAVAGYWDEVQRTANLIKDKESRCEILWKPILPEAAFLLIKKNGAASTYFLDSLSYVNTVSLEPYRVYYLGNLAKTAVLAFDNWKAIYYLSRFRTEALNLNEEYTKQNLIKSLAEATQGLADKEFALNFLNKLMDDVDTFKSLSGKATVYHALAESAHRLGDNNRSFEYFTLAIEALLQNKAPVTRVWDIKVFLLPKAKEIGYDMMAAGLLSKLETAPADVDSSDLCNDRERCKFLVYQDLAEIAVKLSDHERGLSYLSCAISFLSNKTISPGRPFEIIKLAKTAKDLHEFAKAQELSIMAFDMATEKIKRGKDIDYNDHIQTVQKCAKLNANIGKIRYAFSLAETDGFTMEVKAGIMGMVLAEYAEEHYPRIK